MVLLEKNIDTINKFVSNFVMHYGCNSKNGLTKEYGSFYKAYLYTEGSSDHFSITSDGDLLNISIRLKDKSIYDEIANKLDLLIPINCDYSESLFNDLYDLFIELYQIEQSSIISPFANHSWMDFKPSKRARSFRNDFGKKDNIKYFGIHGKNRLLTISRSIVFKFNESGDKIIPLIKIGFPKTAYSKKFIYFYVSAIGDNIIYYKNNKKDLVEITMDAALKKFKNSVEISNFNKLSSSLDTGINYKEFKNLSNDDKKDFFDLSRMNNI